MKASSLCFKAAVLFVLAGMAWGMQMAISQDHSAYPAHAHLNLLGWVSLFLIGIYYRMHPALEHGRLDPGRPVDAAVRLDGLRQRTRGTGFRAFLTG